MKKILTFISALLFASSIQAENYPYLSFLTNDGSIISFATQSLSMTVADGNLVITGASESGTIALENLNKMYFSSTPTAITGAAAYVGKKSLRAYDLSGNCLGTFACDADIARSLPTGTYIIKEEEAGNTKKIYIK